MLAAHWVQTASYTKEQRIQLYVHTEIELF